MEGVIDIILSYVFAVDPSRRPDKDGGVGPYVQR